MPVKSSTAALEAVWSALCVDAGWTADLNCSPSLPALRAYYAKLDALANEREAELRSVIAATRKAVSGFDRHYVDGIEGALDRAITSPRREA